MNDRIKRYIPPVVLDNYGALKSQFTYYKHKKYINNNRRFKNIATEKKLLLIGNGPSLNNIDLSKLDYMDKYVCNDFYVHKDFNDLNVKYYFNMDPREVWVENIVKHVSVERLNEINFFLPLSHYELISRLGDRLKNKNYLLQGGSDYYRYKHYLELHKPILNVMNILQALLLTANYMGYRDVFLAGFDFSFLAYKAKNEIEHFHGGDSRAFQPIEETGAYKRMTGSVNKIFTALEYLKICTNMNVYNLSYEDSFLDIYDKFNVEKLYAEGI